MNCLWNEFGPWSNCTEPCDGGTQTRVRSIKQKAAFGGMACSGYATESRNCNEQPCKGKHMFSPSLLMNYKNVVIAHRNEKIYISFQHIFVSLANCEWSRFAEWTPCSKSCGGGAQTRSRVQAQASRNGGKACAGLATERRACNAQACPGKLPIFILLLQTFRFIILWLISFQFYVSLWLK